jgi:hypothetical protein
LAEASTFPGLRDGVDALVWALTDLMIQPMPHAGLYEWYRLQAEKVTGETAEAAGMSRNKMAIVAYGRHGEPVPFNTDLTSH